MQGYSAKGAGKDMEKKIIAGAISAAAVIGVTPGYFHGNENVIDLDSFGRLYQETADKVFAETHMYCGAAISTCKVLYREEWGCPAGGENCVRIEADCNPSYDQERPIPEFIADWKRAFTAIIEILMTELSQKTVTVAFSDGELSYITG